MLKINSTELRSRISKKPRKKIGIFPTPLQKLNNISDDLGINLFLKREDFSGLSLFGGNKIRKLEFVLGDAVSKGANKIITYGATQSNHALQTVASCCKLGLDASLILAEFVKPDYSDLKSNFLLNHVLGADISTIPVGDMSIEELTAKIVKMGEDKVTAFEAEGHQCYSIPPGANNVAGSLGVTEVFIEIIEQMELAGQKIDYIVQTSGTGGSLSGLIAAKNILGKDDIKIISISAADHDDQNQFKDQIADIANSVCNELEVDAVVNSEDFLLDCSYVGPGYEFPSKEGNEALQYMARKEGVVLDTIYTAKGFAGLIDYVESGKIPKGSNVVFIHTGGATANFSEKEIVGDIVGIK